MGVKFAVGLLAAIALLEQRSDLVSAFQVCQEDRSVCQPTADCSSIFNNMEYLRDPPYCDAHNTTVCCPLPIKEEPVDLTSPWTRQCQKYKEHKRPTAYISDGSPVKKGELPFMARLGQKYENGTIAWGCGGVLIAPSWVLTASHCLEPGYHINVARLGQVNFANEVVDSTAQEFDVVKIQNNAYDGGPKGDIGLLRLKGNAIFNAFVLPACLAVDDTHDSEVFTAAGWGTQVQGGPPSDKLRMVNLHKYPSCEQYEDEEVRKSICAGPVNQNHRGDTCKGDSGGPILVEHPSLHGMHLVVGITSHGQVCGGLRETNSPSVFTKVYYFLEWIGLHVEIDSWK